MERKISCALSLLSLALAYSPAYAGTEGSKPGYPDGFTLGAGAGVTEFMDSGQYNILAGNTLNSLNNRSFRFGFMGDLVAGYGRRIGEPFYFGTEFGLNIFGTRKTSSSNAVQTGVTVTNEEDDISVITNEELSGKTTVSGNVFVPSFDIKPGLLVTPNSLLFARVGINYNQLNVKRQSAYQASGTFITGNDLTLTKVYSGLYSSEKKQLIGLRTGFGFEYLISDNLGLAANYVYAFYNSVNTQGTSISREVACDTLEGCHVNENGAYTASGKSKISDQQALLQVIYHLT